MKAMGWGLETRKSGKTIRLTNHSLRLTICTLRLVSVGGVFQDAPPCFET